MKNLFFGLLIAGIYSLSSCTDFSSGEFSDNSSGGALSGSYTSMVTIGSKLYTVSKEDLSTVDISDPAKPKLIDRQHVGFMIENLYHTSGILFIGSQSAMHIYAINSKGVPEKKSSTPYINFGTDVLPCDPVISDGSFAYATLSSSFDAACGRSVFINELRTYNVKDLSNPILVTTNQMQNPKGLALSNDKLYICEPNFGLSIFNVKVRSLPQPEQTIHDCNCFDVIVKDQLILAVGKNEIFQFAIGPNHVITKLQTIKI